MNARRSLAGWGGKLCCMVSEHISQDVSPSVCACNIRNTAGLHLNEDSCMLLKADIKAVLLHYLKEHSSQFHVSQSKVTFYQNTHILNILFNDSVFE